MTFAGDRMSALVNQIGFYTVSQKNLHRKGRSA